VNTDPTLRKKVTRWLDEAYETEDNRVCEELLGKVLSVSPDNPEASLLLAEVFQGDEDQYRDRLRHVLEVLDRPEAEWSGYLSEGCLPGWLKAAALQRLAFSLLADEESGDEEKTEALALAEELVQNDPDRQTLGRLLHYGALLKLRRYREALKETIKDSADSPERAYTKALASFRLSGPCEEAYQSVCSAIRIDPDLPFLMSGIWEMDDEESEQDDRTHAMALVFGPLLDEDEQAAAWFNTPILIFGFLTGRLPDEMAQTLEPQLEEAGMGDMLKIAQGQLEALLQQDMDRDPEEIDRLAADILAQLGDF
jgi:tetratricopeptide (TPR) repeat protein